MVRPSVTHMPWSRAGESASVFRYMLYRLDVILTARSTSYRCSEPSCQFVSHPTTSLSAPYPRLGCLTVRQPANAQLGSAHGGRYGPYLAQQMAASRCTTMGCDLSYALPLACACSHTCAWEGVPVAWLGAMAVNWRGCRWWEREGSSWRE